MGTLLQRTSGARRNARTNGSESQPLIQQFLGHDDVTDSELSNHIQWLLDNGLRVTPLGATIKEYKLCHADRFCDTEAIESHDPLNRGVNTHFQPGVSGTVEVFRDEKGCLQLSSHFHRDVMLLLFRHRRLRPLAV